MKHILFFVLMGSISMLHAQKDDFFIKGPTSANSEAEFQEQYKKNIRKSKINGIYIPKDLQDAFEEIIALSPEESIVKFKNADEDIVAKKLHHGLGKWMISKWCFYTGSRFSHKLKTKGLSHPDDMAQFVLRTFHRHLNELPLEEQKLIQEYKKVREQKLAERRKERKIISTETRKVDKN